MLTKIEICNIALGLIGGAAIKSFDDPTKEAKICKASFDFVKNKIISRYPFSFARKITKLNKIETDSSTNSYKNVFALPSDIITVIKVLETDIKGAYIISEDKLYSNLDCVTLIYSSQVKNSSLFTPLFIDTLTYTLASDLAINITDNFSLASNLNRLAEEKFNLAVTTDANQNNGLDLQYS